MPDDHAAVFDVLVWVGESLLVHRTVVPEATVSGLGL